MTDLIRLKRENFYVEIRRKQREALFADKRIVIRPRNAQQYFLDLLNDAGTKTSITKDQANAIEAALDNILSSLINEESFKYWANKIDLIESIIDYMSIEQHPNLIKKATNLVQRILKMQSENFNFSQKEFLYDVYKKWFSEPPMIDNALKGVNQLLSCNNQQIKPDELAVKLLQVYHDPTQGKFQTRILRVLARITHQLEEDGTVIEILRIAATQVEDFSLRLRSLGLEIFECASRNVQNVQFIVSMNTFRNIIGFVYHNDKTIQQYAMLILGNVSRTTELYDIKKLFDYGILDVTHKMLKNQLSTFQRKQAALIITNLFASNTMMIQEILQHKIIDFVFQAMEHDTLDISRELYFGWKNFSHVADHLQVINAAQIGLLDYTIFGIRSEDLQIRTNSIQVLFRLTHELTQISLDVLDYLNHLNVRPILEQLLYDNETKGYTELFINTFYDTEFF